jgi:hypothetical protein
MVKAYADLRAKTLAAIAAWRTCAGAEIGRTMREMESSLLSYGQDGSPQAARQGDNAAAGRRGVNPRDPG